MAARIAVGKVALRGFSVVLPKGVSLKILIESAASPPAGPSIVDYMSATPSLILAAAVFYAVVLLRHSLPALVGRLSGVEAFGVKLALSGGAAMAAAIQMAQKHPRWHVEISQDDRDKALARAEKSRALIEGAEILWVDDKPSNNRNEARMLRSFGALITFAATTDEAIEVLTAMPPQRRFDLVISDISRDLPTLMPDAGVTMLKSFVAKRIRVSVIFYVGVCDPTKPTPGHAAGITNRPDQLLHLVIDELAKLR